MTIAAEPSTTPFWEGLSDRGDAPALVSSAGVVTYAALAQRVSALAASLGTTRRLVVLEARNDVDTVVGYLACLAGGHPVLVASPEAAPSLASAYDPDVVLSGEGVREVRSGTRHDLHPSLAVLLSTSGSTGSPKLVRLSSSNVASNAGAIASSLSIRSSDVAATTLPLHYCYGLSVVTSHLSAGASVALTSLSVVDPDFWGLVRSAGVTTFPGVPHTFGLLDRVGFSSMDVPSLRYLTCAGGRLAPSIVSRYAALGQARGFDLFVMYGATEATARMSVLPPDLALAHPGSIGQPIPGGAFTLAPHPFPAEPSRPVARDVTSCAPSRHLLRAERAVRPGEVGELVYRGDNVMLGYAGSPGDLARGRDITELRTGDLARRTPEGLFEIVGRVSRIAKVFGLRVDLARIEQALLDAGVVAHAVDAGDRVAVAVDRSAAPVDTARIRRVVEELGVPAAGVVVHELDGVPRLPSGKPDCATIRAQVAGPAGEGDGSDRRKRRLAPQEVTVRRAYARVLGRPDDAVTDTDSFVTLGGDSLSYVAASLELEKSLGHLPQGWHLMSVADLEATRQDAPGRGGAAGQDAPSRPLSAGRTRRLGRTVETNVLLRAAAIVMIVGSHSNLFMLLGGAHLLVALAGFNFARFQLTDRPRKDRTRNLTTSIARVVVPSVLWLAFAAAFSAKYSLLNVTLLNGLLGSRAWTESWHYWFVEALVWTLVGLAALLAIPAVDRLERRHPFWFPMGLTGVALLTRYDVVRLFHGADVDYIHRAHVIFWLFALGWAAVRAPGNRHKALVSAVAVATVPGFFEGGQHLREATIVAGMLLLVWLPSVRVPAVLARTAGVLAGSSLYIYLVHWQIYPAYEFSLPWLATGLSLTAGIAFWVGVTRATPTVERWFGEIQENRPWLFPRRYQTRDRNTAPLAGSAR